MKNIFLTGPIIIGKSTILNEAIRDFNGTVGGFKTVPQFMEDGARTYVLGSITPGIEAQSKPYICLPDKGGRLRGVPETFDNFGAGILDVCVNSRLDLIIMDELGVYESKALGFQDSVKRALDSKIPVLGVLKAKHNLFLNEIRERQDVLILPVTLDYRDEITRQFKKLVKELLF